MKVTVNALATGSRDNLHTLKQRGGVFQFLNNFLLYLQRVLIVAGVIRSQDTVRDYYIMCHRERILDSIQFAWLGEAGSSFRTSGIYTYFTKLFSILGTKDAVQATSTSQPFLCGNIAPNERLGMKNPNGGTKYMTHPTISFGAGDAWSVTTVVNSNWQARAYYMLSGSAASVWAFITTTAVGFIMGSSPFTQSLITYNTKPLCGKSFSITITYDGTGFCLYINGSYIGYKAGTIIYAPSFVLKNGEQIQGSLFSHIIRSQSLTPQQVKAEYDYLRSIYPEVPSVGIGTQTWATSNFEAVCTVQGNLIQEMQANGNVEKILDTGLNDASKWVIQTGWSISGGVAIRDGNSTGSWIYQTTIGSSKWHKCTFTISRYVSGIIHINAGEAQGAARSSVGTFTEYIYSSSATFGGVVSYTNEAFNGDISDISIQEIGFSSSQELYDGIYTRTAGTAEQKQYAAVKAASMWCHYNNDIALGAVYGKLYNWFAVKLLQMDIDYYNTANPTTPWGWHVPSSTEFATLSTFLSGNAVSGGKLKKEGLTYWNTPNTGATNESGFSAIGGGFRFGNNGAFFTINEVARMHSTTEINSSVSVILSITYNSSAAAILSEEPKTRGYSLRLIKD